MKITGYSRHWYDEREEQWKPYTLSRLYYLHNQILTAARIQKMGFRELQPRVREELL